MLRLKQVMGGYRRGKNGARASLTGMFVSPVPVLALNPPPACEPGQWEVGYGISVSIISGPTIVDPFVQATYTATATDTDYCPSDHTRPSDTVDKFDWYIDNQLYVQHTNCTNNQDSITISFNAWGSHTIKVVADDHPDYVIGDDAPVTSQEYPVSVSDVDYTYDKNGNRRAMCDSRGCTLYEYDDLGRLTKVTEPGGDKWIAYQYDKNSNRTKMTVHLSTTPLVEHITDYKYHDNNLLKSVYDQLAERDINGDPIPTTPHTEYTYKSNGLVDTITYPNGTKAVHSYQIANRNWLTSITNLKSDNTTIIATSTYSYDPTYWGKNGTRTGVIEQIRKPDGSYINAQVEYGYDNLYRLTHEHRTAYGGDPGVAYEYNFAYDAAGNRTSWQVDGGTPTAYTYDDANKMLTAGGSSFTYDVKGNTRFETNGGTVTEYTWDIRNRLTQWAKTGQTTETYLYNADGMRVRKTVGATQTDFLLDMREIAEEMTGSSDVSYIGPGLISKIDGTTRTIYHADGIGSTRAMSNINQAVTQAEVYDAYGNRVTSSSPASDFGFAGQDRYYTDATGLQYLKARYYKPAVGRFLSKDPVGYWEEVNQYDYVGGDPANWVDPDGEKAKKPKEPKPKDPCDWNSGGPYNPQECADKRMQDCMRKAELKHNAREMNKCKSCATGCQEATCADTEDQGVKQVKECWDLCEKVMPK